MIKNLLVSALMFGYFFFNCIGQIPVKINTVKTLSLTKGKSSPSPTNSNPGNSNIFSFNGEKCGSGIIHNHLMATDPAYKVKQEQIEKDLQKTINNWKTGAKLLPPVYTIPLVFHIIHKGEAVGSGTNISDAQVQSAVDALNRDYRRTNADGGIGQGAGPDLEIQFCLATKDPSGNSTTGINRVDGSSVSGYSSGGITSSNETQVKALSKWNNSNYCNIWVVSEIENNGADIANPNQWTGGTLGYAYFPGSPSSVDGIVAVNLCVGNDPNQNQGYRLWFATLTNRTLTHEMGHYLNLYHPFEGQSCSESNCNTQGDLCCDTPPIIGNNTSCNTPECSGTQQVENYMDYTDESCQNQFTANQTSRARAALATGGPRNALNTSANNNCTTCTLTATVSSTNPSCTTNNGSATVTPSGGSTTYSYSWSNGGTTATISNLGAGTYTVTVTSGTCTTTQSVTLTIPGAPTATTSSTNTSSSTACDGAASVTASGGSSPYTYLWSNSATTSSISNLCTGTYTVTVTGSNSCTAIATVTVSAPAPAGCDTIFNYDIATDSATLYSVGGTGWGYVSGHNSYDDRAKADFFTASNGDSIISAILYFGKAYSGNGSSSVDIKIWNGTTGTPGAALGTVTVPISQLSITQPVMVNFSPAVVVTGNFFCGVQFAANGAPQDTVALITNLDGQTTPGTAWEMWSDNTWHHDSSSSTWGLNIAHAIWVIKCTPGGPNCTGFTASATSTNPSCSSNNGTATATASGGTTPYSYSWSNSGTTAAITGLAAGTFSVTVTDANSCTATTSVTLTAPTGPTVTTTGINATTGCDGSATATASGGSSPYSYLWSNSATTANITGLCAGTYTVTVTGSNGCTGTSTVTITSQGGGTCDTLFYFDGVYYAPQASDTAGFQFNTVDNDQKTADSSLIAYGINSNWQVYSEVVSPGDTNRFIGATSYFNPPGQADNWLMFGGVTIPTTGADLTWDYKIANNAYRDGYRVLINTTGATVSDFVSATVLKNVPDNDASTNGDTVWANNSVQITTPFVGQKVYIAFHHNATDQLLIFFDNITVKDCNSSPNCSGFTSSATSTNASCGQNNGTATASSGGGASPYTYAWSTSPSQTTQTATGLSAGNYSVTITAANSCTTTATVTVSATGAPTVSVTSTNATCGQNDGSASASATGGTTPYTYLWSNSATTSTISGLAAGTYSVTVTAANSCTATGSVTVTAAGAPTLTATSTNATCGQSNGTATASATGGTTPYTFLWSNSATTATISGLIAGTYSVTVTGANSCSVSQSVTVSSSGTGPNLTVTSTNAACGTNNGSATVNATGGTSPYTYSWSNSGTTATITGLGAGNYTVTVTGGNCTATATATVTGGGNMAAAVSTQNTNCTNTCTGQASVAPSGGTTPYSYVWSNGGNTASQTGLCTGTYSVTVTDNAGCNVIKQVTISAMSSNMFVNSSSSNDSCNNSVGTATVNAFGGTTPYSYSWNSTPPQTTNTATGLASGNYEGIVTDANGCNDTVSVSVNNVGGVNANVTNNPTICEGNSTTLVASGGTGYLWSSGQTTNTITVTPASSATYYVTVSDIYLCSDTASTTVTVNTIPVTTVSASDDTVCKGDTVMLIASGGSSYFWNNGQTNDTILVAPNNTTTYTVAAQNGNCVGNSVSIKVNVFLPSPNAVASSDVTTTYISQGGTVNFFNTGSTGISYGWDFTGDGTIDATTGNATYSYTGAGTFTVILSATFGNCTDYDTLYITVYNQVGISEPGAGFGILIFPNPNDGKFQISGFDFEVEKIEIFNVLGERIYEQKKISQPETWNVKLETHFPTGVYYVNIISGDKIVTKRVSLMNE